MNATTAIVSLILVAVIALALRAIIKDGKHCCKDCGKCEGCRK